MRTLLRRGRAGRGSEIKSDHSVGLVSMMEGQFYPCGTPSEPPAPPAVPPDAPSPAPQPIPPAADPATPSEPPSS